MSAIQNIKNFIRHGKQAKYANAEPTTNVSAVHAQPQTAGGALSEPNMTEAIKHGVPHGEYSAAAVDNRNLVAQANDVAAHAASKHQKKGADGKYDAAAIEALIAEERASKGKMPSYPGLERWALLEKMGDGAFSNVYRAKDKEGEYDQVAIKVVRKFEMNNQQVRLTFILFVLSSFPVPMLFLCHGTCLSSARVSASSIKTLSHAASQSCLQRRNHSSNGPSIPHADWAHIDLYRATRLCIRTSRRPPKPWRWEDFSYFLSSTFFDDACRRMHANLNRGPTYSKKSR
jgi:hypothetical protein